jgi:L-2-hydroxyglutarate oxidase
MDIIIIGSGIIGLGIANSLLDHKPNLRVAILEKEKVIAAHASGRNSGVMHAGFYYSPQSLKARFCKSGNSELKKLCLIHQIPYKEIGKVVVAKNDEECDRLKDLYQKGIQNGVNIEILNQDQLKNFEPLAITHKRFLWSPTTAVSDPLAILQALKNDFIQKGGQIYFSNKATLALNNNEIVINKSPFKSPYIVNASGAFADKLSRSIGVGKNYAMIPFMGLYKAVSINKLPLKRLVYPVPHKVNPFLGVHFTLTIDGKVKIGPTAIPAFGREQYSLLSPFSISDIIQSFKGAISLVKGSYHNFFEIMQSELPKFSTKLLVEQSAKLVPNTLNVKGWQNKPPGIRSQLIDLSKGKFEMDFVVENFLNSTHILNAVSPGWTSALPFSRWVVEEKILKNL